MGKEYFDRGERKTGVELDANGQPTIVVYFYGDAPVEELTLGHTISNLEVKEKENDSK